MAGKGDIKAGGAYIELLVKNGALIKGLNAAKARLQSFGQGMQSIGATLSVAGTTLLTPLLGAVKHFTDTGSALADMSARTGVSAQTLAELGYAAQQTGTDLETVELAIKGMQKNGFSADQFDDIAASISAIEDPAERTRAALDVFGKAGTKLLPMLNDLAATRQKARDLGIGASPEDIAAADKLGDTWDDIKTSIAAAAFKIGSALAPLLQPVLDQTVKIAVAVGRWVRENGELFRTIAKIGVGLVAAGAIIGTIGTALVGAGAVFGVIASAISGIAAVIGTVGLPLLAVIAGVTLLGAALAAGVVYWVMFTESGKAAMSALLGFLAPFVETFSTMLGGIWDALMGGQFTEAMQIALAGVKSLAYRMAATVVGAVESMIQAVLRTFAAAWNALPDWIKGDKDWTPGKSFVGKFADGLMESAEKNSADLKAKREAVRRPAAAGGISNADTRDNYKAEFAKKMDGPLGGKLLGYTATALSLAGNVIAPRKEDDGKKTRLATEKAAELLADIKKKVDVPKVAP